MIINDLDGYYIVFDTKNWNTELDTLQNRVLSGDLTLNEILEKEIDWDSVNTKLSILREKSFKFLEHSLS